MTHMVERSRVLVTLGVGPDAGDEVSGCTDLEIAKDMGFRERGWQLRCFEPTAVDKNSAQ